MIMDFQYGSTGKGLIAGYLAKRRKYDTAVCAFSTNAGHTYIDDSRGIKMMTQQLPTSIVSDDVKTVLIGPGAAISEEVLIAELDRYDYMMRGKRLLIHPHALVVDDAHINKELKGGYTKIGSTAKGVGEAYIQRIRRNPDDLNTVKARWGAGHPFHDFVATDKQYRDAVDAAGGMIVEGAQGFSLSVYHGQYPYTTSRDVTPWQIGADCAIPFGAASKMEVIGTLRTLPIRVNNRDGSSGPCYPDQMELSWDDVGMTPELTTVTKLPRRIFTFSFQQLKEALWHCGGIETHLFLNFMNYISLEQQHILLDGIATVGGEVAWAGFGPDDSDVEEL